MKHHVVLDNALAHVKDMSTGERGHAIRRGLRAGGSTATLRKGWSKRRTGRPARRASVPRTTGIGSFYTHEILVLANGKKVRVLASNPPVRFGSRRG